MPKISRSKRGMYPAPVYVATFADGSTGRMTFWSQEGKPFDFAAGRRLCAWAFAQPHPETPRHAAAIGWKYRTFDVTAPWLPPLEVVAGHVEHGGAIYPDTMGAPVTAQPVKLSPKRLASDALALLEAGDTAAAIAALRSIAA